MGEFELAPSLVNSGGVPAWASGVATGRVGREILFRLNPRAHAYLHMLGGRVPIMLFHDPKALRVHALGLDYDPRLTLRLVSFP
jgi:hypothetical protein